MTGPKPTRPLQCLNQTLTCSADSEGSHGNRAEAKELQAGCSTRSLLHTQPEMLMLTWPCRGPCLVSCYKPSSELGGQGDIMFCAAFLVIRERIGLDGSVISSIELHLPKQTIPTASPEGKRHRDPHPTKKMSQTNDQFPGDVRKILTALFPCQGPQDTLRAVPDPVWTCPAASPIEGSPALDTSRASILLTTFSAGF